MKNMAASPKQMSVFLTRNSTLGHTPEGKLMIAVLVNAWAEAGFTEKNRRKERGMLAHEAKEFFLDGSANFIADLIGFSGDISDYFIKHHSSCVGSRRQLEEIAA